MSEFSPFVMERWQSIYENQVPYNLSESGVHPLSLDELTALSGVTDIGSTLIVRSVERQRCVTHPHSCVVRLQ
jgi:hypothetical protein